MKLQAAAALAAIAITAGNASADLVVTVESKNLGTNPPQVQIAKISMSTDRLRMEAAGTPAGAAATEGADAGGRVSGMIYRGDRHLVWILDPDSKSYMSVDQQSLQRLGEQMNSVAKQMQEQLEQMPPEQRKMVEQYMKGTPAAQPPSKTVLEIKNSGVRQTVQGYPCVRYDTLVDGSKKSEVWVTSWEKAGVPKESFDVFRQMAAFYQDMIASIPMLQGAATPDRMWSGLDRVDGFPVLARTFDGAAATEETTFKPAGSHKLDAAIFEIPAGYSEKKLSPAPEAHGEK